MNLRPTGTTLGILLCLAAAAPVAWRLGGSVGVGVMAGVLAGASVSALGLARLRRLIARRPQALLRGAAEAFLAKLAVLLGGALLLRFLDPAREQADWRGFLVAFVAGAFVVSLAGSADAARSAAGSRA